MKIRVGVDFDDTLASSNHAVIAWHNRRYGTDHQVGPGSYLLSQVWQVTRAVAEERFNEFVDSPYHDKIELVPFAYDVLKSLRDQCEFFLVTGRMDDTELRTRTWLNACSPSVFSDLIFANYFSNDPSRKRNKGEICTSLRLDAFIEDSPGHADHILTHAENTRLILLDTIWNRDFIDSRFVRATSWRDVPRLLPL
ncbi:MAG: hypothetical protein RIQ56_612 [Candidatus Parcubacteria bacterium]